jgi:phospholipid/cholesterol/gamma-HCH transport system substrate-binding protein
LNRNLAAVTGLLTNDPGAVGNAIKDLNAVVADATQFIKDNRDALGTGTDKLASISATLNNNLDDVKQALHIFPNAAQNFANIYNPSQASLTGIVSTNFLADPVSLLCGAIAAASRVHADYSSKLCVQYLAPIFKNRQYNYPPLGENLFVGESARPNEITYSEDRLRPDYVPPQPAPPPTANVALPTANEPTPAAPSAATDPAAGLPGIMLPAEGGS